MSHEPAALADPAASTGTPPTLAPPWWRRGFCALYEAVLLFGVVFIADYVFDSLTQSRHALMLRHLRMFWLFVVLGVYFVWFWTHGGQTLAMKTWHVKVVERDARALTRKRALLRYLTCWLVILPGPALVALTPLAVPEATLLDAGILLFISMWVLIDPERQALYDRLLGTRLIDPRTPAA